MAALSKYNHECTKCGNTEDLCVHHVIKMFPEDERYNDVENLTVLCRSCHMSIHRLQGDVVPLNPSKTGRRGKNPPVMCSVNGCDRVQHGRALCKKHYEHKRRNEGF